MLNYHDQQFETRDAKVTEGVTSVAARADHTPPLMEKQMGWSCGGSRDEHLLRQANIEPGF